MRLRRARPDVVIDPATRTAHAGDLAIHVEDPDLLDGAADLVRWLRSHPDATHYGFWPPGDADRAIRTHEVQEAVCFDLDSDFEPPHADATAVVAPGALERPRLTLERYEYLRPQSGWFIGGTHGERVTLEDVVTRRPEILPVLALEPGWTVTIDEDGVRVRLRAG